MKSPASSYAPRSTTDIERERRRRERTATARADRERAMLEQTDPNTLAALTLYQQEKARAAQRGRPVLPTIHEWRTGVAASTDDARGHA